jgi:RNA polymerase sigma factor (sigma-70 family)
VKSRAAADSRTGFEQLFYETRTDLLAYIMRRSPNAEDAADVLAETYLIAWRKLDGIPTGDRARLWLFGVARNLLMKGASQRRSRQTLVERLADELRNAHPPHTPIDDERASALRTALAALPERDREIVMLTAWEGLTPKQIAVVVGTPVNVVRVRLHRVRTRLKRDLPKPQRPGASRSLCWRTAASDTPCEGSEMSLDGTSVNGQTVSSASNRG